MQWYVAHTKCDPQKCDFHAESGSEQKLHRHRRSKAKKSKMAARLGDISPGCAWKTNGDHKKSEDDRKTKELVLYQIYS